MKFELGNIIAERSLEAFDEDGKRLELRIKLGIPEHRPDSGDVFVPYQIEHSEQLRLWYAVGIDGFQALQLALKMIVVEIESIERKQGVKVVWGKDLI